MIKTTFRFDHSPTATQDVARFGPQVDAGYVVLTLIDGVRNEFTLPPEENRITIDAPLDAAVQVFVAYRNAQGQMSPARELRFRVRDYVLPEPPGELRMTGVQRSRVVSLPVLG